MVLLCLFLSKYYLGPTVVCSKVVIVSPPERYYLVAFLLSFTEENVSETSSQGFCARR